MSELRCGNCGARVDGTFCTKCGKVSLRSSGSASSEVTQPSLRQGSGYTWLAVAGVVAVSLTAGTVVAVVALKGDDAGSAVVRKTVVVTDERKTQSRGQETAAKSLEISPSAARSSTFHAPSGSVSCRVDERSAECSVAAVGQTFVLPKEGRAFKQSGIALPRSSGKPRSWGESVVLGDVTCRIPTEEEPSGITCRNRSTGHGFEASRIPDRQKTY